MAREEAHCPDDVDDLMQEACLAVWKDRRLLSSSNPYRSTNPCGLATLIMRRAIRSYYWKQREWQGRGEPNKHSSLQEAVTAAAPQEESLEIFYSALEHSAGPLARKVAENLIEVRDAVCIRTIMRECEEKQRRQRRGLSARGAGKRRIRVSRRMIRESLGLNRHEWQSQLTEVRAFTSHWIRTT